MSEAPWYDLSFGSDYELVHSGMLPIAEPEETAAIIGLLRRDPPAQILDLCCGAGRHAIPLAAHGYQLTALDLSGYLLEKGRRRAEERAVSNISWVQSDMREIPGPSRFDAVVCLFNSFGYLENDDEHQRVLDAVGRSLRPGGTFLLQVPNRDALVRTFQPAYFTRLPSGAMFGQEREFDVAAGKIHITYTIVDERENRVLDFFHRLFTFTELKRMLSAAKMRVDGCYGSLYGAPIDVDSPYLIVVSHRT